MNHLLKDFLGRNVSHQEVWTPTRRCRGCRGTDSHGNDGFLRTFRRKLTSNFVVVECFQWFMIMFPTFFLNLWFDGCRPSSDTPIWIHMGHWWLLGKKAESERTSCWVRFGLRSELLGLSWCNHQRRYRDLTTDRHGVSEACICNLLMRGFSFW